MHRRPFAGSAALILAAAITVSCSHLTGIAGLKKLEPAIPAAQVVRGAVEARISLLGELRPARMSSIMAPPIAGGVLQIIYIAKTGTRVKKGDVVVQFDPAEQEYNLEQSKSQLEEAEQQIIKLKADQAVRAAQDKVALLKAEYNLRRAELTIEGNDLLPQIQARKNLIDRDEAKRRLEQLRRDISSRAASDAADLAVQNVARAKALMGMQLAQQNIENMTWRATTDGIVVRGQNIEALMSAGSSSSGIRIYSGMDIPEFQEGDQAYPGRLIVQIQDTGELEIVSKVTEIDRGNLEPGQPVDIVLDSRPGKTFRGRIKSLASSAPSSTIDSLVTSLDALSTRSFDVVFEIENDADDLNLGGTAQVTIKGKNITDVLSIPRQALSQKEGKPAVYRKKGNGWEAQNVLVKYLTESRAIIDGLEEGSEVALVNPDLQKSRSAANSGPLTSILGGTDR
ncbi:MAG: HlyD family efflux transporter periplasmic adaptor subunit [Acidobacteria bacterium]|nr:HlyD family efflux transporter periplasmic adaptor subunit [Acidobacteriota bacterium]